MKEVNTAIYYGEPLRIGGIGERVKKSRERMYTRLCELYGDQYDELGVHAPCDPHTSELLLQDAIKTGKWKELPDCLQEEYHKRI